VINAQAPALALIRNNDCTYRAQYTGKNITRLEVNREVIFGKERTNFDNFRKTKIT